ncbi:MAG: YncE family protein, partial [Gemmatimonadota bacterium]|nr:YncE family protein [Gemmatimonadota bacterium]
MFARTISLAFIAVGAPLVAFPIAAQTSPAGTGVQTYHVTRRIPVVGDGGWDYVTFDTARSRIFISRSTRVQVVDANSGQLIGEIPNTGGVHGIALAYGLNKGYTSNGRDTTVTVFDFVSLAPTKTIRVTGANPDAILFDSVTQRVFTFNGRGESATAIDAAGDTVVGTLALGGKPETAVSDGAGHVFVNIEDRSTIVEFDAVKLAILHTYPLAPCEEPSGLAIDVAHHLLIAGCSNKMMAVVDATNGRVVATPVTDDGTDANAFDPVTGIAFSSNGAGTLTLVTQPAPGKFASENIATERGARTMALDPKTHRAYLITAGFNAAPAP